MAGTTPPSSLQVFVRFSRQALLQDCWEQGRWCKPVCRLCCRVSPHPGDEPQTSFQPLLLACTLTILLQPLLASPVRVLLRPAAQLALVELSCVKPSYGLTGEGLPEDMTPTEILLEQAKIICIRLGPGTINPFPKIGDRLT